MGSDNINSVKTYTVPFLLLCLFALTRPIFSLGFFATISVFNMTLMELYGTLSTYLMLLVIFLTLREQSLDGIFFVLFVYVCYAFLISFSMGGSIKETFRFVLPMLAFFATRGALLNPKQIYIVLFLFLVAYVIPVVGSTVMTLSGEGAYMEVYQTGLVRFRGLYSRIHNFAHAMMVFIFFIFMFDDKFRLNKFKSYILWFIGGGLTICALYNIYKSGTRTVMIGLAVLVACVLYGKKKYVYILLLSIVVVVVFANSATVHDMFFDIIDPLQGKMSVDKMGSGRLGGWKEMWLAFLDTPFYLQVIGNGIGNQNRMYFGKEHNDLLALCISLGYIGIIGYFVVLLRMSWDLIIRSSLAFSSKMFFLGFVTSVVLMNFASNSYLTRFDLSQYFFVICGIFYNSRNIQQSYFTAKNVAL